MIFLILILIILLIYLVRIVIAKIRIDSIFNNHKYGFIDDKKINYNSISFFREIPFNGDIWYTNALLMLNNLQFKKSNILGAVMLKWLNDGKITLIDEKNYKKVLILKEETIFDDDLESILYKLLYKYSNNGKLAISDFKKFVKKNYMDLYIWFSMAIEREIDALKQSGLIHYRITKKECKKEFVMEDKIYDDSLKILGLKKYIENFSNMEYKDLPDVHLWNNYLIYAYLFGNAKIVSKVFDINEIHDVNVITEDAIFYIDKLLSSSMKFLSIRYLLSNVSLFFGLSRSELVDSAISELSKPIELKSDSWDSIDISGDHYSHGGGGGGSFGGGGSMGGR